MEKEYCVYLLIYIGEVKSSEGFKGNCKRVISGNNIIYNYI